MKPYGPDNIPNAPKKTRRNQSRLRDTMGKFSGILQMATTPSSATTDCTTPRTRPKPMKKTTSLTSSMKSKIPKKHILATDVLKDVNQVLGMCKNLTELVSDSIMTANGKDPESTDARCNLNDTRFKKTPVPVSKSMKKWKQWRGEQREAVGRERLLSGKKHIKSYLYARLAFYCAKFDSNTGDPCIHVDYDPEHPNASCDRYSIGFRVHNVGSLIWLHFFHTPNTGITDTQKLFMNLCQIFFGKIRPGQHDPLKASMHEVHTEGNRTVVSFPKKDWNWMAKLIKFMTHSLAATKENTIDIRNMSPAFYHWDAIGTYQPIPVHNEFNEMLPAKTIATFDMTKITLYKCTTVVCEYQFA